MSSILKTLGANRRDCVWFFILGLLSIGYTWGIAEGGQFLIDNNAPPILSFIVGITAIILGCISITVGIFLMIYGMKTLVEGGSSEL